MTLIKAAIKQLTQCVKALEATDCTFWACDCTPENNRIRSMVTCSRCQGIIVLNRQIKKLQLIKL
jgi:predicted metal-binding protein